MIYFATPGQTTAPPTVTATVEHSISSGVFQSSTSVSPLLNISLVGFEGERAEIKPEVREVWEDFDWSDIKLQREYVRLEQKVLAKKSTPGELKRYQVMKRDRNSEIFSDRYVRDYAEVQRLKKLSEKLAEIQQYLRPFTL